MQCSVFNTSQPGCSDVCLGSLLLEKIIMGLAFFRLLSNYSLVSFYYLLSGVSFVVILLYGGALLLLLCLLFGQCRLISAHLRWTSSSIIGQETKIGLPAFQFRKHEDWPRLKSRRTREWLDGVRSFRNSLRIRIRDSHSAFSHELVSFALWCLRFALRFS